jgi:ribonucleoside-diphosphate reductase alpha chain
MQGTGCGFSVEQHYVAQLPVIKAQIEPIVARSFAIKDTTEGWCQALVRGMRVWAEGEDIEFDYSAIRPFGTPLKTKGGRASGPEPLRQLLNMVRAKMLSARGRKLSTLDCHDIACMCGSIVQVGGVRRAAEISLSDLNDKEMRDCKSGPFWESSPWRAMANNSAVYTERPSAEVFLDEWKALVKSKTGERGIFNRTGAIKQMPLRRSRAAYVGVNPCGEVVLRPREFCNLSIVVARAGDDQDDLRRKVKLAATWGTIQSTLTDFNYLRNDWKTNCEAERLLGVDITGIQDNPHLRYTNKTPKRLRRQEFLRELRDLAVETNSQLAHQLGINPSVAVTCVKPSGNSSQLLDCSSGLHPRYAAYYIRRLRIGSGSPIATLLLEAGVPHQPEVGQDPHNPAVWVFEFPVASPPGAVTRHDMTALDQLENWLDLKLDYTEHNPSCTIYVGDAEWMEVGAWVYKHWDEIGGLSFLPKDGGIYQLAPYEEISAQKYSILAQQMPTIDFSRLSVIESADTTELQREFSCTGDRCEL